MYEIRRMILKLMAWWLDREAASGLLFGGRWSAAEANPCWKRYLAPEEFSLVQRALAQGNRCWRAFLDIADPAEHAVLMHELFNDNQHNNAQNNNQNNHNNSQNNVNDNNVHHQNNDNVSPNVSSLSLAHRASFRCRQMLTEQLCLSDASRATSVSQNVSQMSPVAADIARHDVFVDDLYYPLDEEVECFNVWQEAQAWLARSSPKTTASIRFDFDTSKEIIDGLGSMKHLVSMIEKRAQRLNNKRMLKRIQNLLLEVKPKLGNATSKWASHDRVGQVELYEACEKLLDQLKNYKEHSFPFLAKVNKRDAPDYYDIIKNPMDLGTMSKKLKAQQYDSKEQFAHDLQLIWDNCMYYNSDPSSVYRVHATKMQELAASLLKYVPNIEIRLKAELEAEGYDSDYIPISVSPEPSEAGSADTANGTDVKMENAVTLLEKTSQELSTSRDDDAQSISTTDEALDTFLLPTTITSSIGYLASSEDTTPAPNDPTYAEWRRKTWEGRAEIYSSRQSQLAIPFPERDVSLRTSFDMEWYAIQEQSYWRRKAIYQALTPDSSNSRRPSENDVKEKTLCEEEDAFLPELFHFMGTLPCLNDARRYFPWNQFNAGDFFQRASMKQIEEKRSSLAQFSQCFAFHQQSFLIRNIELLRSCKVLDKQFLNLMQQVSQGGPEITKQEFKIPVSIPKRLSIVECQPVTPTQQQSSPPLPFQLTQGTSDDLLKRSISVILLETGFDGASSICLQSLLEVVGEYMAIMGKVLQSYWDVHCQSMSVEEIIFHTLQSVGIESLDTLRYSVFEEPASHRVQLLKLQKRLNDYMDLFTTPSGDEMETDEVDVGDDDAAFMMGDFGKDLGEDYLGLRALGMDLENIPDRLWNNDGKKSRIQNRRQRKIKLIQYITKMLANQQPNETGLGEKQLVTFPPPPRFPMIQSTEGIIGLVKPFYEQKFLIYPPASLVEDEFLPPKPKRKKKKHVPPPATNTSQPNISQLPATVATSETAAANEVAGKSTGATKPKKPSKPRKKKEPAAVPQKAPITLPSSGPGLESSNTIDPLLLLEQGLSSMQHDSEPLINQMGSGTSTPVTMDLSQSQTSAKKRKSSMKQEQVVSQVPTPTIPETGNSQQGILEALSAELELDTIGSIAPSMIMGVTPSSQQVKRKRPDLN